MHRKEDEETKHCCVCGDTATHETERGYLCDKESCSDVSKKSAKTNYLNDPGVQAFLSF